MLEDNIGKIYFERENEISHPYLRNNPDYRFFAQENDEVELEIDSDSQ